MPYGRRHRIGKRPGRLLEGSRRLFGAPEPQTELSFCSAHPDSRLALAQDAGNNPGHEFCGEVELSGGVDVGKAIPTTCGLISGAETHRTKFEFPSQTQSMVAKRNDRTHCHTRVDGIGIEAWKIHEHVASIPVIFPFRHFRERF